MTDFIMVGLGGALGSILHYTISLIPNKHIFPIMTLITNICGAILIWYNSGIALKRNVSAYAVLFFKTGVCGGFTTFSTFSLEAYSLFQNGSYGYVVLYVLLSFTGCLAGVWLGMKLA